MGVRSRQRSGVLITVEGIEGSGKTTQLRRLATRLRGRGYRVVETREPGGTPVAERIREVLLDNGSKHHRSEPMAPACEAFLILAARSQHVAHVIEPALRAGSLVLCDRFFDSTLAYQGYARGMDRKLLGNLNRAATGGLEPDLTLLFDVPVGVGLARRRHYATEQNRLDHETRQFHEKVRRGFLALAAAHRRRIKAINGQSPPDTVASEVASVVTKFLTTLPAGRLKTITVLRRTALSLQR